MESPYAMSEGNDGASGPGALRGINEFDDPGDKKPSSIR